MYMMTTYFATLFTRCHDIVKRDCHITSINTNDSGNNKVKGRIMIRYEINYWSKFKALGLAERLSLLGSAKELNLVETDKQCLSTSMVGRRSTEEMRKKIMKS